jgi:hypothetical protein
VPILPDGRVTTSIQLVHRASGVSGAATVIADTGAAKSALPYHALSTVLTNATLGPVVNFIVAGATISTMIANGLDAKIDTEPHGGGVVSIASSNMGVAIHYLNPGQTPFGTFDGILGMDLLDEFKADTVKDRAATRSYLAGRV